jgi:hypothetical protein
VPQNTDGSPAAANPIDAFICEPAPGPARSLAPEPDRRTLIRRLSFDLLGLPPSPEAVESFVADSSPRAYEQLVEGFLASPHYGERWGRHWLDVAGFAESSLFIGDQVRPGFWRYRDYVIRAFNTDKPYDRFVLEQLAGDELFDWRGTERFTLEQIDLLAATGFLRCPPDATDNQPITQEEKIFATQQSAMEVSLKALLGLTLNCVRCHSHKYDPIPHDDYYRLIGLFQPAYDPSNWLAGIWSAPYPGPIRAIPILDRTGRESYEEHARAWKSERHHLNEQVNGGLARPWRDRTLREQLDQIPDLATREKAAALLRQAEAERAPDEEKLLAHQAEVLGVTEAKLQQSHPAFSNALVQARARLEQIKHEGTNLPPVVWATFDVSTAPSPTRLLRRGDYEQPADPIAPGVLSAIAPECSFRVVAAPNPASTGRRLALARWITDAKHPLTARVLVNRLWQYHFGTGLVATPDDFGARGSRPTQPALLDWLAAELQSHHWSIKHVQRLILTSSTYRQASAADTTHGPPALRLPRRRLEAELVRDAMLDVAGLLDRRLYGESVPTQRLLDGRNVVATNHPGRFRRSVYLSTRRTTVPSFLAAFDAPVMDANWPKRSDSVIPQQALGLMNSPFALECAEGFAARTLREGGPTFESRLRRAFLLAYGRPPSGEDLELFQRAARPAESAFDPETSGAAGPAPDELEVWTTLCHALLSANEFLYVD